MALPSDSSYWSPSGVASLQNKMRQEGLSVDDMMADIPNTSLDTQKVLYNKYIGSKYLETQR